MPDEINNSLFLIKKQDTAQLLQKLYYGSNELPFTFMSSKNNLEKWSVINKPFPFGPKFIPLLLKPIHSLYFFNEEVGTISGNIFMLENKRREKFTITKNVNEYYLTHYDWRETYHLYGYHSERKITSIFVNVLRINERFTLRFFNRFKALSE